MENDVFSKPKRTDSVKEILEMQEKFFSEKKKNKNFQPAAQVTWVDKGKKQSLFAKSRLIKETEKEESKSLDISNIILGDVVEKPTIQHFDMVIKNSHEKDSIEESGFPKVERVKIKQNQSGKSLFALSIERKRHINNKKEDGVEPRRVKTLRENYGETSMIVEDISTAKQIHDENVELISKMKEEEILAERAKLLQTIDPNLIKFIEEKRKQKYMMKQTTKVKNIETVTEEESKKKEVKENLFSNDIPMVTPVAELLNEGAAEKWIHFDVIEKEKFEWMKDIPMKSAKLKPGEVFEARFDWKGVLLPYSENDDNNCEEKKDNRELYLHGDEPHRPGYTLQELFRLARSNITQQRISAFGAITGILNIYNQGFYDNILELPISKIFFLLRFGLDENIPSLLEVVSKGLSVLFYNDTDETILDLIAETSVGYLQPKLELDELNDSNKTENLENSMINLKLTSSSSLPFTANIEENEEESKTSLNDFHLAETDLIECLLRTNIIQRINYILGTVQPKNSTVLSCLKILIRIARTNKEAALKIISHEDLMNSLIKYFLPGLEHIGSKNENEFYFFPQFLVLKLFRILICQHLSFCIKILNMNIIEKLKNYLFTREDIKAKLIKVQIESLRILRVIMILKPDSTLYREFLPAFRYMLEWHYQHIIYEQGGPFLIRQHAAALLNCISSYGITITKEIKNLLGEGIFICCCKWFYDAIRFGVQEFSQSILLSSCLNCVVWYMENDNEHKFKDFIEKYLKSFILSNSFLEFEQNLRFSSILCKHLNDRRNIHSALLNLGSVLEDDYNGSPELIISQLYPVYFLNELLKVIEQTTTKYQKDDLDLIECFKQSKIIAPLLNFLEKISLKANQKLATNFLAKAEIKLIFKLLCLKEIRILLSKETLLRLTYRILCCMTVEHIREIEILFDLVIFKEENLLADQNLLSNWKQIYLEAFVYPHSIVIQTTDICLSMPCTKHTILPNDWPYWLLKNLLNDYLQQISTGKIKKDSDFSETEIVKITLTFTSLLQNCGLQITSPTEELMYLMMAFMGQESQFLEPSMKILLKDRIEKFYKSCKNINFDFDAKFEGKSKFENLYVLFLNQFQAASYGDDLFSSLVMIPLAQKYDCKWRKMVWSEHVSALRFLNCKEDQLLGSLSAYFYPVETKFSLVKCYSDALNLNLLRIDSIPYKIATHHVNNFKKKHEIMENIDQIK